VWAAAVARFLQREGCRSRARVSTPLRLSAFGPPQIQRQRQVLEKRDCRAAGRIERS